MRPPAQAALEVDEAAAADLDSQWGGLMIDAERVVDAPASGAGCCTSAAESPEEEQEQIQQQERPTSDGYAVKVDQQEYDQESIEQQSQLGNTASSPGEEEWVESCVRYLLVTQTQNTRYITSPASYRCKEFRICGIQCFRRNIWIVVAACVVPGAAAAAAATLAVFLRCS
jgi:hypothetical protein